MATLPAFIAMVFTMAIEVACAVETIGDAGTATADGASRILFKTGSLQVSKMSGREFRGVMTDRTGITFTPNMLIMLTGIIVVVLVRDIATIACIMTGSTLGVDINGPGQPAWSGLAAMTPGAGAGAVPVGNCRTALGVEAGQNVDISSAVIMRGTVMAGTAARIY